MFALRQAESGTPVAEACRKMDIVEQTFYRWKKKYIGMGVAEVRRIKILEEENRKLKQLVADLSLDKQMFRMSYEKKVKACSILGIWSVVGGMLRNKCTEGMSGAPEPAFGLLIAEGGVAQNRVMFNDNTRHHALRCMAGSPAL